jgi:2-hydroxychromene-2-carboxylate isomerase
MKAPLDFYFDFSSPYGYRRRRRSKRWPPGMAAA